MKKCRKSEPLVASEEPLDHQINSIETIENIYSRYQTNGSQLSLTNSETSMPPKYEMPPSYSQAVSTLTLHYWNLVILISVMAKVMYRPNIIQNSSLLNPFSEKRVNNAQISKDVPLGHPCFDQKH